ncbi:isoprenylcysteine carboxylmethyltransferase family protein [Candidatus Hecatella orcuttiae]|jgi:protein-S-isoprenylcysteine O-methyltransferase Ste14|uniref:methyltransferase family protein n=1 Tax=Candidatus Hecatella orcuttiae TaxID=1935119 RepID=UPI002867D2AC|nr:isoprenylcysteine carboxylmethyltransferase family protein [Candidatus Hecatella orcuttiae]
MTWEFWNRWDLVLANVALFSLFLLLMPFKRRSAWGSRGAFIGFLVALFTEMYGLPLTVYVIAPFLLPFSGSSQWLWSGHLFGWVGIAVGTPILILGGALIVAGWRAVHRAVSSDGGLVTDGVYRFVRHPQYLGLMLLTLGWLVHWPTIIGAAMWPFLVLLYYRLARREEKDLEMKFGERFHKYRNTVPMLLPKSKFKLLVIGNNKKMRESHG